MKMYPYYNINSDYVTAWMSNPITIIFLEVITNPCPKLNAGSSGFMSHTRVNHTDSCLY